MGEYTEREKEVVEYLVEQINTQIYLNEQEEIDKVKLEYVLCSNNYEKLLVTKKRISKYKAKIDKCNPEVAAYIVELAKPTPKDFNFDCWRDHITKNFLFSNFTELIEELALIEQEEIENYTFSSIVKSRGYKYKDIKDYFEGVCNISHYTTYKSLLDIPLDENQDYNNILTKINNAFFRLESFMNGTNNEYYHFDFNKAFSELLYFTRQSDNYTIDNCKRIGEYWELTEQIRVDFDQSDFKNLKAYKNKDFVKDCNSIININYDRIEEFSSFATPDEIKSQNKKKSISDITNSPLLKEEQNLDNNSTYYENLSNDPLFEKTNEYTNLKAAFLKEYKSRTAHYPDNDYLFEVNDNIELKEWEETEKEKLNNAFLKMIKDLNNKKTFFFGCSFANYEHNYPIRLNQFLENFYDATELEFINEELEFLENIIYDLQNSESAHDGYSQSGIDNFLKAYDVVSITDYKQYLFSHNKKVEFLEIKKSNFNAVKPIINKPIDLIEIETTNPHPQVFSNLKAFQLFEKLHNQFKDSNNKMADFSFIYRKMYNDKFILNHFKPQMFIGWINTEPYNINLDKIKTLNDCSTTQKVNTYTTTKELMQLT